MRYLAVLLLPAVAVSAWSCPITQTGTRVAIDERSPATAVIASAPFQSRLITPPFASGAPQDIRADFAQAAEEPKLKMVLIRASAVEVRQLRKMPLDIVRVSPIVEVEKPTTKADLLDRRFIVEAVVPSVLLTKLTDLGFDVTAAP